MLDMLLDSFVWYVYNPGFRIDNYGDRLSVSGWCQLSHAVVLIVLISHPHVHTLPSVQHLNTTS